ncbi:MAG: class D beta-lactamase [Anaerolineales bacterium]
MGRCSRLLICSLLLLLSACRPETRVEALSQLAAHFEAYDVEGAFMLYDQQADVYRVYNAPRCEERFLPASTFKILNALIALETGVIADEREILPWDGVDRALPEWNQDLDLQRAMRYSAIWFYQDLARRVGQERMRTYVEAAGYGNADVSGPEDAFWLEGALRISPAEQIDFLRRLHAGTLPFSERSQRVVREILVVEETETYRLSAKTGWVLRVEPQVGWYVGYVERGEEVYFFATNIESAQPDERFGPAKVEISRAILTELGILPLE